MSQIIYPITHLPPVIDIGKQTEKGVTRIGFDVHEWLDDWPGMAFSVQPTRPGETESYLAASEMVGSVVFWLVGAVDTEKPGSGTVEVLGVTEDERKLSFMCRTSIANTNTATVAEVPEPNQPWVDQVLNAAKSVNEAAGRVEKSVRDLFIAHFDNDSYTLDKSYAEITDARLAGKSCVVVDSFGKVYTYVENRKVGNGYAYHFASAPYSGVSGKGVYGIMTEGINVGRNGECTTSRGVPAVTPNPRKLKLTGAVEAEYDGSDEVVVEIPDAGLPETAAPLKQLVTDADGKVTWEDRLAYETEREVVNLEATGLEGMDDDGDGTNESFFLLTPWLVDIKAGSVYEVTYNGVPYECPAVEVTENEVTLCVLGNAEIMGTPGGNPDAPFVLWAFPNGNELGFYGMFIPADGATSVTISVRGVEHAIKTIDPKYLPPEAQHKRITLTIDKEGNLTSDTDFETAWAMDAAVLQSCVVIAEDGGLSADASSTERNSVSRVYKYDVNGVRSIQIQYENNVFDFSEPTSHTFTRYINWGCYGTETSLAMDGYTRHEMPFKGYPSTKAYLYWTGSEWRFATIDQLKADLGLT